MDNIPPSDSMQELVLGPVRTTHAAFVRLLPLADSALAAPHIHTHTATSLPSSCSRSPGTVTMHPTLLVLQALHRVQVLRKLVLVTPVVLLVLVLALVPHQRLQLVLWLPVKLCAHCH